MVDSARSRPRNIKRERAVGEGGDAPEAERDHHDGVTTGDLLTRQTEITGPADAGRENGGNDVGEIRERQREQMDLRLCLAQFHGLSNDAGNEEVEQDAGEGKRDADRVSKTVHHGLRLVTCVRAEGGKVTRGPRVVG